VSSERDSRPSVGVIGLGVMGRPIAGHLLKAGHPVTVLDLDEGAAVQAANLGAMVASDAAELAAASDVVLVIVPSDADAVSVCVGERGVMAGARSGSAVLLCSSVRPSTCAEIAAAAPEGVGVLDAALTGGVRGVEAGKINLMVGGDQEVLDGARPALASWCTAVHLLGPLGAGQVGKTVNNLIHWAEVCAITESLSLGAAYGLDIPTLRAALQASPVDSRALHEIEQMRFTWHAKDMANAEVMAADVGMSLPLAAVARDLMVDTTVGGVAELLARRAEPSQGPLSGYTATTPVLR
jgi:3-hydroxyisobutyrate dehydrogenase-like beta-hydroxyacid dehydrogenase